MADHDPARMTMRTSTTRLMAAGAIGNLLEWYDFA